MDMDNVDTCKKTSSKWQRLTAVNISMIPVKVTYLAWGGITGTVPAFLNIFFISVGLSASQAGFISGIRFTTSAIVGPLWGALADYTGRRKLVLVILCLGGASLITPLPWVARAFSHYSKNITCHQENNTTNRVTSDITGNECPELKVVNITYMFYTMIVIMLIGSAFIVPLPGYVDSIAMNVVKTGKTKASYGGQRIFGSVGCSLATFFVGLAVDHYHHPEMSHYTPVFYVFLCYTLLMLPMGCHLLAHAHFEKRKQKDLIDDNKNTKVYKDIRIGKLLWNMIRNFDVIFFVITVIISGIAMNMFIYFSLLLVNDQMQRTKAQMSLVLVTGSLSNMVIFPLSAQLIKLLGGPSQAITLGMFSYFIRYIVMSYTTSFGIMVSMQALHGFGFALAWAAMMEHLHKIAPKQVHLTVFLVMSSIQFGISSLITNMAGGYIFEHLGSRVLFRGAGVMCGIWTVCMIIYYSVKYVRNKNNHIVAIPVGNIVGYGKTATKDIEVGNGLAGTDNPIIKIDDF